VVLPDSPSRLGFGAIYTYYEFSVDPEDRMTEETWQSVVASDAPPAAPQWTSMFIIR
jgi:hypothetical protein